MHGIKYLIFWTQSSEVSFSFFNRVLRSCFSATVIHVSHFEKVHFVPYRAVFVRRVTKASLTKNGPISMSKSNSRIIVFNVSHVMRAWSF